MSEIEPVHAILEICRARGIVLSTKGEKICLDAQEEVITENLLQELRRYKADLLPLLQKDASESDARLYINNPDKLPIENTDTTPWNECIEPPPPCPNCGGIAFWWDAVEGQHCMLCEPPRYPLEKSIKLRKLAQQLRKFPRKANSLRPIR